MRKHFLILMLLALLPLAGFAEDLDMTKFVAENIHYGATVLPDVSTGTPATYTEGTHYEVSTVYYTDEALTNEKAVSALPTQGSGQYWLKITGKGTYAGQVYPLSFWIIGTDIIAANIANVDAVTYTGSPFTPKPVVTFGNPAVTLVEGTHFTYSYENNTNAGTATITINGKGNYSGTATKNFTIKQADITAEMVTAPTALTGLEYTGQPQTLVADGSVSGLAAGNTVSFNYKFDGDTWYAKENDAVKKTNAGDNYVLTWKVVGNANYKDYVPTTANTVTCAIDKAILVARAQAITTFYGNALDADNDIQITYEDFVEGEGEADNTLNGEYVDGIQKAAGFVAPTKSFSITTFNYGKYTDGIVLTGGSADNYEIITVNNTLTIEKAKLKLTLMQGKTATFGTAAASDKSWQLKITDLYNATSNSTGALKLEVQTAALTAANPYTLVDVQDNVKNYLTVSTATTGTTVGDITDLFIKANGNTSGAVNTEGYALTLEGGTAMSNYEIYVRDGNDKKLVINAAELTITAANKVKIYGEPDPTWTYTVTGGTVTEAMDLQIQAALTRVAGETAGNYIISFGTTAPQFAGYNIDYKTGKLVIQKAALTITAANQSLYTGNTQSDLGETEDEDYTIEGLVGNDAADVSLAFAPMVYDFTSWNAASEGTQYATGTAKVVSFDATNHKTTIEVLSNTSTNAYVSAEEAAAFVGKRYTVASTDLDAAGRLQLTDATNNTAINVWVATQFASGVKYGEDNKLVVQNDVADGIQVVLANQAALSANYKITLNAGDLKVINLTETLNLANNKDNNDAIEAADGTTVNVTFDARELKRETWSIMVLPFETTVTEVSSKLGYAVVNIVDKATYTGNDLRLKLHMGKIEANQPFLVKYYKDNTPAVLFDADGATAYNAAHTDQVSAGDVQYSAIDFSTLDLAGRAEVTTTAPFTAAIAPVVFNAKEIVYVEEAKDEDPRGNIFYGVYAPTDVYGHEYATTTKDGVIKRLGKFDESDPFTIVPTNGYFKMADAEARIFIEEPDGSTTVIKGINADGEAIVDNEGWYTLNGVKLQGAPTQKGIYINNGKKIVVK